jgi:hypothetical protein
MGKSIESLCPAERLNFYFGMAAEAVRISQLGKDEHQKAASLRTAARWQGLAELVQLRIEREDDIVPSRVRLFPPRLDQEAS